MPLLLRCPNCQYLLPLSSPSLNDHPHTSIPHTPDNPLTRLTLSKGPRTLTTHYPTHLIQKLRPGDTSRRAAHRLATQQARLTYLTTLEASLLD